MQRSPHGQTNVRELAPRHGAEPVIGRREASIRGRLWPRAGGPPDEHGRATLRARSHRSHPSWAMLVGCGATDLCLAMTNHESIRAPDRPKKKIVVFTSFQRGGVTPTPVLLAEGHLPVMRQMEQDAVPARPVSPAGPPGAWDSALRALRPVCEELAERSSGQIVNPGKHASAALGQKSAAVERREARLPDRKGGRRASQACRGVRNTPGLRKPRVSRRFTTPHIPGASRRGNADGCP